MARLIHGVATATPSARLANPLTDLTRLLSRLQQTVLRADAEREARLRTSEFEREKVQTNINFARSLLTKLEQEALAIKIHTRKHELQTDLVLKREVLDQLTERMRDLAEIAAAAGDDDDDDDGGEWGGNTSEEGEDILADIIATPSESLDSLRSLDVQPQDGTDDYDDDGEEQNDYSIPDMREPQQPPSQLLRQQPQQEKGQPARKEDIPISEKPASPPQPPPHHQQELRSRRRATSTETAEKRSALFGDGRGATTTVLSTTATTEAILDHQRAEHDILTESILKLATDLKKSSQAFSSSLEEDAEVVARAGEGMSKTGESMDAVTKRMSTLQKMTEGEGWWGRMRLYVQVYGLMLVLVLVVFVLPKLRF
ncbi:synaptobrevin [Podospora didyma]|uniref:Synaptobrevin n=1 Tax=Podospora didyma TaxID=330526 RepID=A0AAE0KE46_9PEZI|nr:synaptobrevin [Podospora didyma]